MNVLLVTHNFPPHNWGGVETYALNLARALQGQGCQVTVLHPGAPSARGSAIEADQFQGVPVRRLSAPAGDSTSTLSQPEAEAAFAAFLAAGRYDLVHFHHTLRFPMSLVAVAGAAGVPVALTLHDFWLICPRTHLFIAPGRPACDGPESAAGCAACLMGEAWRGLGPGQRAPTLAFLSARLEAGRATVSAADLVSAPSAFVARAFDRAGAGGGAIEVAPLGLPALAPAPPRPARPLTFGFIGSIQGVKNVLALVEAFAAVRGDVRLEIAGGGAPEALAELARRATDPRIALRGPYQPADLPGLLARLDVVVVPSLVESYCFTAREALAAGLPVLASRVGGLPEAVRHGENGLLFDPLAPGELAACLQSLADDPSRLARLRPAPVAPTIEADAAGWLARYRTLVARRSAAAAPPPAPATAPSPCAPAAPGAAVSTPREAYLLEPAWDGTEWISAVLDFLQAFGPDDPVALLLALDPGRAGQPTVEEAGARVMQVIGRSGKERFPEILLLEPGELLEGLRQFTRARWVRTGPGAGHQAGGRFIDPPRAQAPRGLRVNRAG